MIVHDVPFMLQQQDELVWATASFRAKFFSFFYSGGDVNSPVFTVVLQLRPRDDIELSDMILYDNSTVCITPNVYFASDGGYYVNVQIPDPITGDIPACLVFGMYCKNKCKKNCVYHKLRPIKRDLD